jgi:hypothetical protein
MRCKCCNAPNALAYDPPDYYCGQCIEIIFNTKGDNFTLSDLYTILIPEDDDELVEINK